MPAEQGFFINHTGKNSGHGGPMMETLVAASYEGLPPGAGCPIRTYSWESLDIIKATPTGGADPHNKFTNVVDRVHLTKYMGTSFDDLLFIEHDTDVRGERRGTGDVYQVELTDKLAQDIHRVSIQSRWNWRLDLKKHRRETNEAVMRGGLQWPDYGEEVEPFTPGYAAYVDRAVQVGREFHAKLEPFLEYTPLIVTPLTSAPLKEAVEIFLRQRN